jgi:glutathione-regulated potassium-efflux system ancillary protein KefG
MTEILILFAHPALEKSRVQKALMRAAKKVESVSFRDLYELYPDMEIDIDKEQQVLLKHKVILFQHPFYWYSAPAIIKQWLDLVLEHGWAYGATGNKLHGKWAGNVISAGGSESAYTAEGRNKHTINELLVPYKQTAMLCGMQYLPPFVVHGTHRLQQSGIDEYAQHYQQLLQALVDEKHDWTTIQSVNYLNQLPL